MRGQLSRNPVRGRPPGPARKHVGKTGLVAVTQGRCNGFERFAVFEQSLSLARASMRSVMGAADFERPTAASLTAAKVRMDQKMNFSRAPQDLRDMHDQVCSMIVRKVA